MESSEIVNSLTKLENLALWPFVLGLDKSGGPLELPGCRQELDPEALGNGEDP